MLNQQELKGHWNEIQGKLQSRWGELSGDELDQFEGNVDQLVGMIQQKTGDAREEVENFVLDILSDPKRDVQKASEAVRQGARDVAENVSEAAAYAGETAKAMADKATEQLREGYHNTEEIVRRRPMESLSVCLGAGLITGVVVGLMLRSR